MPESCTANIPPELNFGDVSDTTIVHDMAVDIRTACNSNTLKYNVYIDGGTGSDNAALTMSNDDGPTGSLQYGLFTTNARNVAFPRTAFVGDVNNLGPHTRSSDASGSIVTIFGRVPIQPRPVTGNYSDTVTVHVEY